ncbi:hypothetical protein [Streptomyces sp. NPDC096033]
MIEREWEWDYAFHSNGGWFETQILSRSRPRLIAVVAVVSPPNLR